MEESNISEKKLIQSEIMERIEFIRNDFGKSKKDFAESLEIPKSYYYRLLNGEKPLSLKIILDIHEIFHADIHWLLSGESPNRDSWYPTDQQKMLLDYKERFKKYWQWSWDNRPENELTKEERGQLFLDNFSNLSRLDKIACLKKLIFDKSFRRVIFGNHFLWTLFSNVFYSKLDEDGDRIGDFERLSEKFPLIFTALGDGRVKREFLEELGEFPNITDFFTQFVSFQNKTE